MATITEALAEIKTINARIEKKREFVLAYLFRQDGLKDPLEKDGGSVAVLVRERQAITDLEKRIVQLRRGIAKANDATTIAVNGGSETIADWLTWRRDVAPNRQAFFRALQQRLATLRNTAQRSGHAVVQAIATTGADSKPTDFVVNIDEGDLAKSMEDMEEVLGTLDGQLSLKNATIMIEV